MARIFISHSSRNNAEVLALREWLVSQGWNDLFLDIHPTDGLVAAERWQAALRSSIGRCKAVIFCLSPEWVASPHCLSEFNEAMHVGAAPVGVIVKSVPLTQLPGEMSSIWQIVDLARGGTPHEFVVAPPPERQPISVSFPGEELQALRGGLAKLGLVGFEAESFSWPPPGDPDRSPYRGLVALETADAGIFFGRDSDLVRMREELFSLREKGGGQLAVILGPSGAGKSSFLRAGVMPRLMREDRDFLPLPVVRPRTEVLSGNEGLAEALAQCFALLRIPRSKGELGELITREPNATLRLLSELQDRVTRTFVGEGRNLVQRPPTVVLGIDQIEELFAPEGRHEADCFLRILASVLKGGETIVVATIRTDRFGELQRAARDYAIPTVHPFDLGPVTPFVFRDAITGPAKRANQPIGIEANLTERLVGDMAAQGADPLPLLAFTLERLYRDFGRFERRISLSHYERLGGLEGSIEAAVKEAVARPNEHPAIPDTRHEQGRLLEQVFVPALADINEVNNQPIRRIAAAAELPAAGTGLIARLTEARLLVRASRMTPRGEIEPTIEVAHEALLRQWAALRRILDSRSSEIRELRGIERAAEAWARSGKWKEHPVTSRIVERLESRLRSVKAFGASRRRDLRDLFRGSEWLDHKGNRLDAAQKLMRQTEFLPRLTGDVQAYLSACQRSENFARRKRRYNIGATRIFMYVGLFVLCLALMLAL